MARIGLPVPPGFTITTDVCTYFYKNKRSYPKSLDGQIRSSVALMEKQLSKKLGDTKTIAPIRPFWSQRLDARHDGHNPESWTE